MTTTSPSKLIQLYREIRSGAPVLAEDLRSLGISADLVVHYVRVGYLTRLARGVYMQPLDDLKLEPSLVALQKLVDGLHVGGKSTFEWQGNSQYVAQRPTLHLYGRDSTKLPEWFTERFPAEYHRKRLFKEDGVKPLYVAPFQKQKGAPNISSPERALLELLSEVGVRQGLSEARELTESTYSLRSNVLQDLLKNCTSVKTVRLCLMLGNQLSLPWAKKLDPTQLPTGSERPWISRSEEGLLILK